MRGGESGPGLNPCSKNRRERFFTTEGSLKGEAQGSAEYIPLNAAYKVPESRGFFMRGGESGPGLNPWFKKSPGAIFHDRREPAGQGAGKRRVKNRRERFFSSAASPTNSTGSNLNSRRLARRAETMDGWSNGKAQGSAAYNPWSAISGQQEHSG